MILNILSFIMVLMLNMGLSFAFLKFKRVSIFITTICFLLLFGNFFYIQCAKLINLNITLIDSKNNILNYIYHFFIGLLLLEIFYDFLLLKKEQLNISIIKKSFITFLIPASVGFLISIFYGKEFNQGIAIGIIFSVTAIPILAKFLHNSKLDPNVKIKIMSIAIITDILAWSISLLFNNINFIDLSYLFLSFVIFFWISKKFNIWFVLLFYISYFIFLNIQHLFSIVLPIIVAINKKEELGIFLGIIKKYKIIDYILIPFIILYVSYNINIFNYIKNINNISYAISLIILPIFIKIFSNFLICYKEKNKYYISILLNTRGLTEIVFLNMFLNMSLINNEDYIYFMLMTFISTLLPIFFHTSKNHKQ